MGAATISIVMPTLNTGKYVAAAVESIIAQSHRRWELLVMDAGSTDGTAEIVSGFGDDRIRLYQEPDEGPADAWDRGNARATGEYLMFICGSDGLADRDWLATCEAVFRNDSHVGLVWGLPRWCDEEGNVGDYHRPYARLADPEVAARYRKEGWLLPWLVSAMTFPDGNMCVHRSVMLRCMPPYHAGTRVCDKMMAFYYNFNVLGYLSFVVPVGANFTRYHLGRLGDRVALQRRLTVMDYTRRVRMYRRQLIDGARTHVFRDAHGNPVGEKVIEHMGERDFYVRAEDGKLVDGTRLLDAQFPAGPW
jgi:glycosyltransferase involved in cell wall biosynthesis